MATFEDRLAALEFHMELLVKHLDKERNPWEHLIISRQLTRQEVHILYKNCEEMSIEMKKQKAEGFVTFSPLLTQFEQTLHPRLPVEETIDALHKEGMFIELMTAFRELFKKK